MIENTLRVADLTQHPSINLSFGSHLVGNWLGNLSPSFSPCGFLFHKVRNGGGFYLSPATNRPLSIVSPTGFDGEMSAEAAGIVASLFALDQLISIDADEKHIFQYYRLRELASQHPERVPIFSAVDGLVDGAGYIDDPVPQDVSLSAEFDNSQRCRMNKFKDRNKDLNKSTYLQGITHGICLVVLCLFIAAFNVDLHHVLTLVQRVVDFYLSALYQAVWSYFSPHFSFYLGVAVGICPTIVAIAALIAVKKMSVYSEHDREPWADYPADVVAHS